jgi:hypothetical protein
LSKIFIYNFYKSTFYNYDQILSSNSNEDLNKYKVIGINCYEEILNSSDFVSFKNQSFPDIEIIFKDIQFYSKRLNILISEKRNSHL